MKKYLQNPFNALYQNSSLLSNKPQIQELNQYAIDLESRIAGDFNLEYLTFEFAYNQLAFVRNGLLLAKIKFLKLYKNYGDGTFAGFCKHQLKKQRWQINDTIKAARVVLDLMYAGFEILPTNISQAVALAKLTIDELIEKWRSIIETIPYDEITAKAIRDLTNPYTEKETTAIIKLPAFLHEEIHREAADRGLTIASFLKILLDFFLLEDSVTTLNLGVNSHLLQSEQNTKEYIKQERIWQQDLANLVAENS